MLRYIPRTNLYLLLSWTRNSAFTEKLYFNDSFLKTLRFIFLQIIHHYHYDCDYDAWEPPQFFRVTFTVSISSVSALLRQSIPA